MKNHHDSLKELIYKLVQWLRENQYPPQLTPSRSTVMFKRKTVSYSSNVNQLILNSFISRYDGITREKILKLTDIYKSKTFYLENWSLISKKECEADIDLTDFKFVEGDKVAHDGFTSTVIKVLDETIYLEFDRDEISGTKRQPYLWVETDYKNLELICLKEHEEDLIVKESSQMEIDK